MNVDSSPISTGTQSSEAQQLAVLLWLRFIRVYQKADRTIGSHLRCMGLSPAQFEMLAHIGAAEGITQQELANSLLVTKGNVCQLLDRMEHGGLLERRQAGRANRLFLTDKGRELVTRVVPALDAVIADTFSVLSPEEQEQLLDLLRKADHRLS